MTIVEHDKDLIKRAISEIDQSVAELQLVNSKLEITFEDLLEYYGEVVKGESNTFQEWKAGISIFLHGLIEISDNLKKINSEFSKVDN